jgi:hypothetical protein
MEHVNVAFMICGGAPGVINIFTSSSQVPLLLTSILCGSPGVIYACHAFIIDTLSIAAAIADEVSVEFADMEEVSLLAVAAESLEITYVVLSAFSSLQEIRAMHSEVQRSNFFITAFFGLKSKYKIMY